MKYLEHEFYRELVGNGTWNGTITSKDYLENDYDRYNVAKLKGVTFRFAQSDPLLDVATLTVNVYHPTIVDDEEEPALIARYIIGGVNTNVLMDDRIFAHGFLYEIGLLEDIDEESVERTTSVLTNIIPVRVDLYRK